MPSIRRRGAALLLSIVLPLSSMHLARVAHAEPTAAEMETARVLFNEGKTLRDKGDLQGALDKLKAANALGGTPITGLELGRTHMMMGHLVEAREAFLAVARIAVKPNESPKAKAARAEADKLANDVKSRIPELLVVIKGVAAGQTATVTIDGDAIPSEALGVAHKLNPGSHEVVARLASGKEQKATVDLKEGESRSIELVFPAEVAVVPIPTATATTTTTTKPPPPPPPPIERKTPPPGPASSDHTLAYVGFGVAGAGVLVGSITGLIAMSKTGDLKDQCPNKLCPTSNKGDIDSAKTMGNVSTIAFGVGAAGLVVGVIGLLTAGPSSSAQTGALRPGVSVFLGPTEAGLRGAF